ncbi:MAG TPA: DUF5103 domain-containing protein [Bacteroidales bacterium]|nr:DUF5103 domain-containing protein [Bacteroidales bacterium]
MMKKILLLITVMIVAMLTGRSQTDPDDYYQEDFVRNSSYIYKDYIRAVLMHPDGAPMSKPVVKLKSSERLVFSFDDLSADYKKYGYTIIHCDADWNVSDLVPTEYLETFQDDYIDDFAYSVNTMQPYVHYHGVIPNENISYRLSGNYLLKVYLADDPEEVIFTHRFFVVDPRVQVVARVRKPLDVSERDWRQEVVFNIQTMGLSLTDPRQEIKVTLRQNGRWDNAITDLKPRSITGTDLLYDYDGVNVFDGGNAFRYFDLKSLRYNSFRVAETDYDPMEGYQVFLHDDVVKKKNVFENVQESINGLFLIKTEDMEIDNTMADYAQVHFFLPYDYPLATGKLYLMGGLTYWQFIPEAELKYNYDRKGYEASLLLKQGFYNYQYLFLPNNATRGETELTEGNFFDSNNDYSFFVYYRPVGGRFDRLVNVTTILTFPE